MKRTIQWKLMRQPVMVTGFAATAALLTGCQENTPPNSAAPPITLQTMERYVTGQAAARLTISGHFQLQSPATNETAQITRDQAIALAAVWPRQFGPWLHQRLESQHGGPIELRTLTPCGEALYATSPYSPLSGSLAVKPEAQAARRMYGPWWIVSLCTPAGAPKVSVAVAAYSTELRIEDSEIRFPSIGGEWFSVEGIPRLAGQDFLELPEHAVQRVAILTGLRVSEVPELIIPDRRDGFPNHARWRVTLERPAIGRTTRGRQVTTAEVYSWRRPGAPKAGLLVPSSTQPDRVSFRYPTDFASARPDQPLAWSEGSVARRPGIAASFEPVALLGGN